MTEQTLERMQDLQISKVRQTNFKKVAEKFGRMPGSEKISCDAGGLESFLVKIQRHEGIDVNPPVGEDDISSESDDSDSSNSSSEVADGAVEQLFKRRKLG